MNKIVEFLQDVTGLVEGEEKIELRVKTSTGMTPFFFKKAAPAVALAERKSETGDVYFGVAPRKRASVSGKKKDVAKVSSLWIDLDAKGKTNFRSLRKRAQRFLLPPSYVVHSGGGYHVYWMLEEPVGIDEAEDGLKALQRFFGSDHVTDASRVLRVPGTLNHKKSTPREVVIELAEPKRQFSLNDIIVATRTSFDLVRLIRGDRKGDFKSRSERDYAIIGELCKRGAALDLVEYLYATVPTLQETTEDHGADYVERTYEKAKGAVGEVNEEEFEVTVVDEIPQSKKKTRSVIEFEDRGTAYYVNDAQVSTFILEPKRLLDSPTGEEVVVCNVVTEWSTAQNVPFPRSAFVRKDTLHRRLQRFEWQWFGSDKQTQALVTHLHNQLQEHSTERTAGTFILGLHDDLWVSQRMTISPNIVYNGVDAPVAYVESDNQAPYLKYNMKVPDAEYTEMLRELVKLLPTVNRPEVMYPALAWYMATPLKPLIHSVARAQFPILTFFGTRGSGKTSLIQQVFQRLTGYSRPVSYDCQTTKYSRDVLLGTSNAVPVSFAEYRDSDKRIQEEIARLIRLSYDGASSTRGKRYDVSRGLNTYELTAPFTLDGEDMVTDPACQERTVSVILRPETIRPGEECFEAFSNLIRLPLEDFAGRYIQFCLNHGEALLSKESWNGYIDRAQALARPQMLPARIANNYAVMFFGLRMFQQFLHQHDIAFKVPTNAFKESLSFSFATQMGRTILAVDDFVTDIINELSKARATDFAWRYIERKDELYIHFTPAYNWWREQLNRRRLPVPGKSAIREQLKERVGMDLGSYVISLDSPKYMTKTKQQRALVLNLEKASKVLDIPYPLALNQIVLIRKKDED